MITEDELENYLLEFDNISIGDFTISKVGKWGLGKKVVTDENIINEVFLLYLIKVLENNPGIKKELLEKLKEEK